MAFVAIYDANVLYPGSLRDLLIRLGQTGLFQAKWTDQILSTRWSMPSWLPNLTLQIRCNVPGS